MKKQPITKQYDLFIKGYQPDSLPPILKAGETIHILASYNQVPFKIKQVLIDGDVYDIDIPAVNVGAKAKLTVNLKRDYPSDVNVSLIGDQIQFNYIGPPLPENKDGTNIWERFPKPSPWDKGEDVNDEKRWETIYTQGLLAAQIINSDYYEPHYFDVPSGRDGAMLLPPWITTDDIPGIIKSIFIEPEDPNDKKWLYICDVRVGKNSQFIGAEPIPVDAVKYLETDTMNVGQLLTIMIDNRKPPTSCGECGHLIPAKPIRIRGHVMIETYAYDNDTDIVKRKKVLDGPVN